MVPARIEVQQLCSLYGLKTSTLPSKVTQTVQEARAANVERGSRGQVRCGRSWRGQRLDQIPYRDDSIPVFVSKGRGQIGNAVSPFTLDVPADMMAWATVDGSANGQLLPSPQKLELVWQCAKKAEGESWDDYFTRRRRIYAGKTPKRRYIERGTDIAGACFGPQEQGLVQYLPSRVFYCLAYEISVSQTPEFHFLHALVESGFNLLLLGPDGHPLDVATDATSEAYIDGSLQFGHERVLVSMLRGERPWASKPRCW